MEFFIDDKETEAVFQEIFKKVQILRNGETHSEMKKYGLNYQKSLGATIVNLRELASGYSKDHLLAHKLWTKAFRETKILASLLEEPEKVNEDQINRWLDEMDSNELIEQVSMNLFLNMPNVYELIPEWLQSENYRRVLCAVIISGRLAMKKDEVKVRELFKFVEMIPSNIDEYYLRNQMKRSLGKMVRVNKEIADTICEKVRGLRAKDENWQEVWDDLQYELDL
ncbi:DNA alkylation repair protein [Marinifilum flexuosum]|uniref:DNA alkylation repair enzyme n=1 Tax=Marinifilum flexuosum TaxID=1117708 RepID=A0A419X7F9_9BACT|nr:DNA alkylation repair protein [Marinifilum flexuosum]RKE03625.1 DNA alkylation repair enzyme [Marinifilum flexuosum]